MMNYIGLTVCIGVSLSAPQYRYQALSPAPVKAPTTTELPSPAKIVDGAPAPIVCSTQFTVLWDTEYQVITEEKCSTVYRKECQPQIEQLCRNTTRQECNLVPQEHCTTVYQKVCMEEYKTVYEPFTETECTVIEKEDCEFRWQHIEGAKVWAPIPGTCKNNPYEDCKDVTKTQEKLVSYSVCKNVPKEQCQNVDREECFEVLDKICNSQQVQKCNDVPQEICYVSHKKVPIRVSRQVAKKVCNNFDNSKAPPADNDINRIDESIEFKEDIEEEEAVDEIRDQAEKLVAADEDKGRVNFNEEKNMIVFKN